jgi:transposase
MRKTRKRYTEEFKAQAVELVEAGNSVAEVAADFEIEISCLYAWTRQLRSKDAQPSQIGSAVLRAAGDQDVADELRRLRRENADLRLDNEILKKAAVILGTKIQPNAGR